MSSPSVQVIWVEQQCICHYILRLSLTTMIKLFVDHVEEVVQGLFKFKENKLGGSNHRRAKLRKHHCHFVEVVVPKLYLEVHQNISLLTWLWSSASITRKIEQKLMKIFINHIVFFITMLPSHYFFTPPTKTSSSSHYYKQYNTGHCFLLQHHAHSSSGFVSNLSKAQCHASWEIRWT